MDSFTEQRERKRLEHLHQLMAPHLDDYLTEGFQGVVLHSDGWLFAIQPQAAAIFGYTAEEPLYENAMMFFPAESAKQLMQQLLSQTTEVYTVTAIHKDGSEFQVQLKGENLEVDSEPVRAVQLRRIRS